MVARQYGQWGAFQTHIKPTTDAVEIESHHPTSHASDYVSERSSESPQLVSRAKIEINSLHNKWTGDLAWPGVAGAMKATHSDVVMGLNGGDDLVCVRHGLVPIAQPTKEMGYKIDPDFFVNGQIAMTEIAGKLTEYHQATQRFFKLWITDMLHQAMKPST